MSLTNMEYYMTLDKPSLTIYINTPKINFDILPEEVIEDGKNLQKLFTDFKELTEKKLRNNNYKYSSKKKTTYEQEQVVLWELEALSISVEFFNQIEAGKGLKEIATHFLGDGEKITLKYLKDSLDQFIDFHRDYLKSISSEYALIDLTFEFTNSDTIKQLVTANDVWEEGQTLINDYMQKNIKNIN